MENPIELIKNLPPKYLIIGGVGAVGLAYYIHKRHTISADASPVATDDTSSTDPTSGDEGTPFPVATDSGGVGGGYYQTPLDATTATQAPVPSTVTINLPAYASVPVPTGGGVQGSTVAAHSPTVKAPTVAPRGMYLAGGGLLPIPKAAPKGTKKKTKEVGYKTSEKAKGF